MEIQHRLKVNVLFGQKNMTLVSKGNLRVQTTNGVDSCDSATIMQLGEQLQQ